MIEILKKQSKSWLEEEGKERGSKWRTWQELMYVCRGIIVHTAATKMVKLEESKDEAEQVGRGSSRRKAYGLGPD